MGRMYKPLSAPSARPQRNDVPPSLMGADLPDVVYRGWEPIVEETTHITPIGASTLSWRGLSTNGPATKKTVLNAIASTVQPEHRAPRRPWPNQRGHLVKSQSSSQRVHQFVVLPILTCAHSNV